MTKKRLSDLLKEEASKSDSADLSNDLPNPESPPESRRPLSRRRGTAAALHSSSQSLPSSEPSIPSQAPESDATTPEIPSPSGLDPRIADLEQALAAVEAKKAVLESTVKALQTDLEAQQERLFELKDHLDKSQAELQEAKQTILKLSQVNKTPTTAAVAKSSVSKSPSRISGVDILPRSPSQSAPQPGYVRGVPTQPSQTSQPNPMISNEDIGWVD